MIRQTDHPAYRITDQTILRHRGSKNLVDPRRPYAFIHEQECGPAGVIEDVATLFLTNKECPFRCLMCDLWKNTTDDPISEGDIIHQIEFALHQLPPAATIKLYNSGNFFDRKAIPPSDYAEIARLVAPFERVIIENHPNLCKDDCIAFRDIIDGRLEIAMGLETVHPEVLPALNKRMTLDDFTRAAGFLRENDIDVRAFILLRPPFLDEAEGVEWALKSIEFAFDAGVQCCAVIPTRPGNGMIEFLATQGFFEPPVLSSIEHVLEAGLALNRGRVFMDLWDLDRFYDCLSCGPARKNRLHQMNLSQEHLPAVSCACRS